MAKCTPERQDGKTEWCLAELEFSTGPKRAREPLEGSVNKLYH